MHMVLTTLPPSSSAKQPNSLSSAWQRPGDAHDSTVEVAVTPGATGTTITFTHERLADAAEQKRMQKHWADVAVHVSESLLG